MMHTKAFGLGYVVIALSIFLTSCKPDVKKIAGGQYFNLKTYFRNEAARLGSRSKLSIKKTAQHNGDSQEKRVHISNWALELSLFAESDINKPAWRQSYSTRIKNDSTIYTAQSTELKTREIMIKKVGGVVKWIKIRNLSTNMLYKSAENLSYYPDSLYQIEKTQQVRLMGTNNYLIKGEF